MIDPTTLITYTLIVLGFVFIPGPATMLTMARAASSGTKAGIATGAGIAAGDLFHTTMAIVGLSAVIATSALLFSVIKYAGAVFLIYLGIRAMLDKAPLGVTGDAPSISVGRAFRQAVLTEMLNPKTALFFLAFLPQFVRPEHGAIALQLAVFGVVFVLLGLLSTVVFAVGAGRLGNLLRHHPAVVRWQGKVVGTIYCAVGVRLALQER
ncbi:Threonine/homoserine/homoserine lactone efflux protein [Bradyrhizobium shewense]|uniref:Threonine/homoserine/homoserine lactone efflux protein n=1 Tax=Bradyrhizobium shewense TaxID=1761772 RepID=A0A1C3WEV0_9BRAD|nr:LysE family translocator [Bradyrhizobium shewense]SCB38559.1 Threonine/homoserine/homoserine lactone efflux protein [Bradyrhizobium shewense]